MEFKKFAIFKNNRKNKETQPDYNLVLKGENGKTLYAAGAWINEGSNGKYFGGVMSDEFKIS